MKKVCIVGYGAIGTAHAFALGETKGAKLCAVCDIDAHRADDCSREYAVKAYYDFEDALADTSIDSIHICTPHYLHFDMIKKSLAAGKDVVCEKPVTRTKAEFNELLTLDGADRVCVILQNRLNPCVKKLREIVTTGALGKIKTAKGILTWQRTAEYYAHDGWRGKWATEGGGVLINQAIHTLDFFSYITGGISSLKAQMANFSLDSIEVEDTFAARLRLACGADAVFFATNAYGANSAPEFEIIFENGTARYADKKLFVNGEAAESDSNEYIKKKYWGIQHANLFKNYYENGKFFSPFDAANTMNSVFAMYESAQNGGKEVRVQA